MKPVTFFALYRPKLGSEQALRELLKQHPLIMRQEKLVTSRPGILLQALDGTFIEVMDWVDEQAFKRAHENPRIQELWGKAAELATFPALKELAEAERPFPNFKSARLEHLKGRNFSDTMIAAKDYEALIAFYEKTTDLQLSFRSTSYALLVDPVTLQSLCITNGASVGVTAPGVAVGDLEATLEQIQAAGGKVVKTWEYPEMKGANCQDPEGNELLIWS